MQERKRTWKGGSPYKRGQRGKDGYETWQEDPWCFLMKGRRRYSRSAWKRQNGRWLKETWSDQGKMFRNPGQYSSCLEILAFQPMIFPSQLQCPMPSAQCPDYQSWGGWTAPGSDSSTSQTQEGHAWQWLTKRYWHRKHKPSQALILKPWDLKSFRSQMNLDISIFLFNFNWNLRKIT